MKIAVIGASGKQGSLLVKEGMSRGHEVTGFVRKGESIANKTIVKDVFDLKYNDIKDYEVIIDALGFWAEEDLPLHGKSLMYLCNILKNKENRLLVVGGAGSLYVNPEHTVKLMEGPDFPEMFKPLASAQGQALEDLRKVDNVKWTFLSPAADFRADGERIGEYKLGGEELTLNANGESIISYADYAIAMIDEAENANYIGKRFSVVSK